MVRADIRITNHIQLERMGSLGERKLKFNVEALRYRDAFDREQLARALLADPAWPLRAAKALGVKPEVPPQYLRAAL